ncbi:MAG: hypothetical protein WBG91_14110, partial [Syntrophobacteria bacterium]
TGQGSGNQDLHVPVSPALQPVKGDNYIKYPGPSKIPLRGEGPASAQATARQAPASVQDSTISYQVFENMNSRTAEQGTAEYRSAKHFLIPFNNFCCSKFLVRYLIFKI